MNIEERSTLESTAHHEAGHAVVAAAQGLHTTFVTIDPADDYLGLHVHPSVLGYEIASSRDARRIARQCILVAYAGFEAEKLFNPQAEEWRSQDDRESAFDLSSEYGVLPRGAGYVGDEAHIRFLDRLRAESRKLVRRNWQSVVQVAEALLDHRTLDFEQVAAILTRNSQAA